MCNVFIYFCWKTYETVSYISINIRRWCKDNNKIIYVCILTHMDIYKWKNIRIKQLYFNEQMKHFLDKKELVLFEISFLFLSNIRNFFLWFFLNKTEIAYVKTSRECLKHSWWQQLSHQALPLIYLFSERTREQIITIFLHGTNSIALGYSHSCRMMWYFEQCWFTPI